MLKKLTENYWKYNHNNNNNKTKLEYKQTKLMCIFQGLYCNAIVIKIAVLVIRFITGVNG